MTDKQINTSIAEACGWTDIHDDPTWEWLGRPPKSSGSGWPILPYCECLNAMHEAEKTLGDPAIRREYAYLLGCIVKGGIRFDAIHATARQRAEAFLRTIGKWEE